MELAMDMGRARTVWTSQCEATSSIRERFEQEAALEYLVSEKLLNFAEAAASHPAFAHELPMFVAEVRRMFTPKELRQHLAVLVPRVEAAAKVDAEPDEDNFEMISPQELVARLERLGLMKQLLEVDHLGTS
jgi:hypothetical protein